MRTSDFHYPLPPSLIARHPVEPRSGSRLLLVDGARAAHHDLRFADLPALLKPSDLLVFNDTRVIPARLVGVKESGGRVEALIERVLGNRPAAVPDAALPPASMQSSLRRPASALQGRSNAARGSGKPGAAAVSGVVDAHRALAQVRASKPPKIGTRLDFENGVSARVVARRGEFYELEFESDAPVIELLERAGHVPLPPYIARPETATGPSPGNSSRRCSTSSVPGVVARGPRLPDEVEGPDTGRSRLGTRLDPIGDEAYHRARYQTVYARHPGAVAAPTAGLHFDAALLERLEALGVEFGWLTLHVGAGTFQPVRVEHVAQHRMHSERVRLDARLCGQVNAARAAGRRVVAVGTTAVRALETVAGGDGRLTPFEGETDIFIYPGYRFRVVDALLTNFHLPGSTLLMLVCAFGGTETVLAAYRHAVGQKYRFYSYGDAMFVLPQRKEEREKGKT